MSAAHRSTVGVIVPQASELGWAVVEASSRPVVAFDRAGNVGLANAAARELWGLGADGPGSGRPARWFTDGADPRVAVPPADGSPLLQWRTLAPVHGPPRPALVQTQALRDPGGVVIGSVMTVVAVESTVDRQLQSYASDLEMLAEVSRLLSEVSDPEEAAAMTCTVATGATGASAMLLWKLTDGSLQLSHQEDCLPTDDFDVVAAAAPGAVRALESSERRIEHVSAGGEPIGDDDPAEPAAGSFTLWHEPLISGGQLSGVLTIVWGGVLSDPNRPAALISSLAQHSATALERSELLRRLALAARTDALTGLANRRVWQERLEHEMLRVERDDHPLSLILIDIDHFKRYNDTHGHPEGDRLLGEAARVWSQRVRATDLLARVGGEEFAVLLPACSQADAVRVADALRTAVPFGQTCSLGVATFAAGATATQLYGAADAALYRAKRGGRDRIEVGSVGPTG